MVSDSFSSPLKQTGSVTLIMIIMLCTFFVMGPKSVVVEQAALQDGQLPHEEAPSSSSQSSSSATTIISNPLNKEKRVVPLSIEQLNALKADVFDTTSKSMTPLAAIQAKVPFRRVGDYSMLRRRSDHTQQQRQRDDMATPTKRSVSKTNKTTETDNSAHRNSQQQHRLVQSGSRHRASGDETPHVIGKRSGYGWRFVRYTPSQMETEYLIDVTKIERQNSFSSLKPKFAKYFNEYVRMVPYATNPNITDTVRYATQCVEYVHNVTRGLPLHDNTCGMQEQGGFDPTVFSHFEYEFTCLDNGEIDPERSCESSFAPSWPPVGEKHISYIEPLVGLLRHPNVFLMSGPERGDFVLDKQYMFVDKWALNHLGFRWQRAEKRSIYVDMGASQYDSGAGGASQNWFVALTQCVCTPSSDLFLWEAAAIDQRKLYRQIPGPLLPNYHYYNIPLVTDRNSWNNPLNVLLKKAHNDDVVVLKVDFDVGKLEMEIMQQILEVRELSDRIDELFFEHHILMPVMKAYWWKSVSKMFISSSIKLFQALRERGIRAHSWV